MYARYRDPNGAQRTKSFDRKIDAERYLTGVEGAKLTGTYVDPTRSRVTLGAWADLWIDAQADLPPRQGTDTKASSVRISGLAGDRCASQTCHTQTCSGG